MPSIISHHYNKDNAPNTTDTNPQGTDSPNQGNPQNAPLPYSYDTQESLAANPSTTNLDIRDIENDPKGLLSRVYQRIVNILKSTVNSIRGNNNNTNNIDSTEQTKPTTINTKEWIENEIKALRSLVESGNLHIDNFIHELARLASLSFFHSSQIEKDEIKHRQEQLQHLFSEQQKRYSDNKVFATDMSNAVLCAVGGSIGLFVPGVATAATTLSQGGSSISKIAGNANDREKTELQHSIDQLIKTIDNGRNHSSSTDQQSTKLGDHLTQAQQMRQSIVAEVNRG